MSAKTNSTVGILTFNNFLKFDVSITNQSNDLNIQYKEVVWLMSLGLDVRSFTAHIKVDNILLYYLFSGV